MNFTEFQNMQRSSRIIGMRDIFKLSTSKRNIIICTALLFYQNVYFNPYQHPHMPPLSG